jgi:hypothetical protein
VARQDSTPLAQFFGFSAQAQVGAGRGTRLPGSAAVREDVPSAAGIDAIAGSLRSPCRRKPDVQPLAVPPAVVSSIPRVDTPPPPIVAAGPVSAHAGAALRSTPKSRADFRERTRDNDLRAREARRALTQSVPPIASQTQSEIAPVLRAAARAQDPRTEREVIDAAQAIWVDTSRLASAIGRPHGETAQWTRRCSVLGSPQHSGGLRSLAQGVRRESQYPEVVGNLAFLHLRMSPSPPETARQLALHAIAVRGGASAAAGSKTGTRMRSRAR